MSRCLCTVSWVCVCVCSKCKVCLGMWRWCMCAPFSFFLFFYELLAPAAVWRPLRPPACRLQILKGLLAEQLSGALLGTKVLWTFPSLVLSARSFVNNITSKAAVCLKCKRLQETSRHLQRNRSRTVTVTRPKYPNVSTGCQSTITSEKCLLRDSVSPQRFRQWNMSESSFIWLEKAFLQRYSTN